METRRLFVDFYSYCFSFDISVTQLLLFIYLLSKATIIDIVAVVWLQKK